MQFMEEELLAASGNFADANKLGAGGFGVVYKGWLHGCNIAIKLLTQVC